MRRAALGKLDGWKGSIVELLLPIVFAALLILLKDLADGLFVHVQAVRNRAMYESDRVVRSVVDHMHIIEAIEARHADLAARLVREHTMGLHKHVRRSWTDFSDAASKANTNSTAVSARQQAMDPDEPVQASQRTQRGKVREP